MDNHWTRALKECCEHTSPIALPCSSCTSHILGKLQAIWQGELRQELKSEESDTDRELIKLRAELDNVMAVRNKFDKQLTEKQRAIEELKQANRETRRILDDYEARDHAEQASKTAKVLLSKLRVETE